MSMNGKNGGNLHTGHRNRMRKKFRESGFDSFEPHEMLEMLLFHSYTRGNTNPIGHELIRRFGSLDGVLGATYEELCAVPGVGPRSADLILSVRRRTEDALVKQYRRCGPLNRERCTVLASWFMRRAAEEDAGLLLTDAENRFLGFRLLRGALNGESDPTELAGRIAAQTAYGCLITADGAGMTHDLAVWLVGYLCAGSTVLSDVFVLSDNGLSSLLAEN